MDQENNLVLQYIGPVVYTCGVLNVADDTVKEFQDQDEQVVIKTGCEVPGVKRGWLGDITVTKTYIKIVNPCEAVKLNEVLRNMLCIRVNTYVGEDGHAVVEYVFLKH